MSERYDYTYTSSNTQEFELRTIWEPDQAEEVAAEAAEDFFSNHDGWESSWPRKFTIFHEGKTVGTYTVDMEAVPRFYCLVT